MHYFTRDVGVGIELLWHRLIDTKLDFLKESIGIWDKVIELNWRSYLIERYYFLRARKEYFCGNKYQTIYDPIHLSPADEIYEYGKNYDPVENKHFYIFAVWVENPDAEDRDYDFKGRSLYAERCLEDVERLKKEYNSKNKEIKMTIKKVCYPEL